MKNKYQWKIPSFAKGIKPEKALSEIERIENVYGGLTAKNILLASEDKRAVFHNLFTWDDGEAAEKYRLSEARRIMNNIEVSIVSDGEIHTVPVFEIVSVPDGSRVYKNISDFDVNDVSEIKSRTIAELNALKNKLSFYKDFAHVISKLDEVIAII